MAATTAVVLMAVSTAAQMAMQAQQGRAEGRAYETQAKVNEINADNQARDTSLNEDTKRRQNRLEMAKIAGAQAEAGLVGGTATGSYMQSLKNAEQDALNLRYQGMSQWQNYKNSAMFNRAYGAQARSNARTSAFTTGFGGLAQAFAWGAPKGAFGQKIASYFKGA